MTAPTPQAVAASDEDLLVLLRVIGDFAERSEAVGSSDVSRRLGWNDVDTAASLADARERLLIWGMRVGGTPAPRFEDIELTVQGRRMLVTLDRAATTAVGKRRGTRPALSDD